MALLGAPLGAFYAALTIDRIGRKKTTLSLAPVMLASMVAIAYSKTILLISAARFFIGAVEGGLYTVLPMYIAEISKPEIRGFLTSTIDVATITGTLFINAIGPYTSIYTSSLICSLVPVLHFFTFVWMPESPYFLVKTCRLDEARVSLQRLRGTRYVDEELSAIVEAVKRQEAGKKSKLKDLFKVKSNRSAVLFYVLVVTTNKFSGNNPLLFYTTTIFVKSNTRIDPTVSVLIYCAVRLFGTVTALGIVDRFGRRPLLAFSGAGCAFFLFLEGLYFLLQEINSEAISYLEWLPVTALLGYNIVFSLGLSYGPVLLLGELFPTNVKAAALGMGDSFSVVMGTVASKYFQGMMETFGFSVPFMTFSFCCVIGTCLILKYLPETKGKTLEEIQLYLIGVNK